MPSVRRFVRTRQTLRYRCFCTPPNHPTTERAKKVIAPKSWVYIRTKILNILNCNPIIKKNRRGRDFWCQMTLSNEFSTGGRIINRFPIDSGSEPIPRLWTVTLFGQISPLTAVEPWNPMTSIGPASSDPRNHFIIYFLLLWIAFCLVLADLLIENTSPPPPFRRKEVISHC